MTKQVASYALQLGGEVLPTVPRAFGLVSREIKDTQAQLNALITHQNTLDKEFANVQKGTQAYDLLEKEVKDARMEAGELNKTLKSQTDEWSKVTERTQKWRNLTLAGIGVITAAVAGLILQINHLGGEFGNQLFVLDQIGIEFEEFHRYRILAKAVGQDLPVERFREFQLVIQNIQEGWRRTQEDAARTGAVIDARDYFATGASRALRELHLDIQGLTSNDLPLIVDRLNDIPDALRRWQLANEIAPGILPQLLQIEEAYKRTGASIRDVNVPTREQAEEFEKAKIELTYMREELNQTSVIMGATFVPAITAGLEVIQPMVGAFGDLVQQHPQVLAVLAGVGVGVVGLVGTIWALNAALAVKQALSGPAGWASLGVAAALGTGVAVGGGFALRNITASIQASELEADRREMDTSIQTNRAVFLGARDGTLSANEAHRRVLQNILPPCPAAALEEAVEPLKVFTTQKADEFRRDELITPPREARSSGSRLEELDFEGGRPSSVVGSTEYEGAVTREMVTSYIRELGMLNKQRQEEIAKSNEGVAEILKNVREGLGEEFEGLVKDVQNSLRNAKLDLELDPEDREAIATVRRLQGFVENQLNPYDQFAGKSDSAELAALRVIFQERLENTSPTARLEIPRAVESNINRARPTPTPTSVYEENFNRGVQNGEIRTVTIGEVNISDSTANLDLLQESLRELMDN